MPAEGACRFICPKERSARSTSNFDFCWPALRSRWSPAFRVLSDFVASLLLAVPARRLPASVWLLHLRSWRRFPVYWPRAWLTPRQARFQHGGFVFFFGQSRLRTRLVDPACADFRLDRYCARSCSVFVLSNSTTTSPGFTAVPSADDFDDLQIACIRRRADRHRFQRLHLAAKLQRIEKLSALDSSLERSVRAFANRTAPSTTPLPASTESRWPTPCAASKVGGSALSSRTACSRRP